MDEFEKDNCERNEFLSFDEEPTTFENEERRYLATPQFQVGDKVRMKQEVLDELDREGTWAWHESLKGKVLTVSMIDAGLVWVDYYVVESPFCLAEKWLEAAKDE